MKKQSYFLYLMIFLSNSVFAQTKEELIAGIIKVNSLDDFDGLDQFDDFVPQMSNEINDCNYYNFEKLKLLLSKSELFELCNHENQVLRLYAIAELIEINDPNLDIIGTILKEIKHNRSIKSKSGCIRSEDLTYSVVYHNYWNHIRLNALEGNYEKSDENKSSIMLDTVNKDPLMREINTAILELEDDIDWLIYDRMFEIKEYHDSLKSAIIQHLYKNNNSYAYEYLKRNYPNEFPLIHKTYFEQYFPLALFYSENQSFYLYKFTKMAFENKNKEMQGLAVKKLQSTGKRNTYLGSDLEEKIFKHYKVKL